MRQPRVFRRIGRGSRSQATSSKWLVGITINFHDSFGERRRTRLPASGIGVRVQMPCATHRSNQTRSLGAKLLNDGIGRYFSISRRDNGAPLSSIRFAAVSDSPPYRMERCDGAEDTTGFAQGARPIPRYRATPSSNGLGSSLLIEWHGMSIALSRPTQSNVQWVMRTVVSPPQAMQAATNGIRKEQL